MAVRIIEAIDPQDIRVRKISSDGIQNTIKYEISAKIDYDESKKLTVETEISDSVSLYSQSNEAVQLTLVRVAPKELTMTITYPKEELLTEDVVVNILTDLLAECEHVNI